ncbi:MAG: laccase domain-containing protein [bacterium]|nr:laccase domain-containing protein [bacterium]
MKHDTDLIEYPPHERRFRRESAAWRLPDLEKVPHLQHGISDRSDGNIALYRGDQEISLANRMKFYQANDIDPSRMVKPTIAHGTEVKVIGEDDLGKGALSSAKDLEIDGLVSFITDTTLSFDTADCQVLMFWDDAARGIGLAHSGWKGTDGNIAAKMIEELSQKIPVEEIKVTFGAGICGECYRFPKEIDHPLKQLPNWGRYRTDYDDGSASFNINGYLKDQLIEAGVKSENIDIDTNLCTTHTTTQDSEESAFFSHRLASQKGEEASLAEGRFMTYLSFKPKT